MSYAEITFRDKNPVKRWLQRRRLVSAIKFAYCSHPLPEVVCDFGAGNGELIKTLADRYPHAKLICYEPTLSLLEEARENLMAIPNVDFIVDVRRIEVAAVDVVFCLEVFEHLPPEETIDALQRIRAMLRPEGVVIVGVPVEIGIPAFYKGLFRASRRYGAFDASVKHIVQAILGHPPRNRPMGEIAPGLRFHHEHMGFDYRCFEGVLRSHFKLTGMFASPFVVLGPKLMPEVYFVAERSLDPMFQRAASGSI